MGKRIKIYNPQTGEKTFVNSIYEIPFGWERRVMSDEHKKKISEKAKERGAPECAFRDKKGDKNPFYGKEHPSKGKKIYYDKDTLQIYYFSNIDEVPENMIKGRPPKTKP